MKFGVSSYSFSAYQKASGCDYFALCDLAKEIGFDGIEFIDLNPALAGVETEAQAAEKIREKCEALGLPIFAYTVSANFLDGNMAAMEEKICGKLDVAKILGVPLLRHDAAWSLPSGMTWEAGIEEMAPAIRRVAAYGESLGIRTCTENHGYLYQAPERVLRLIQTVNHKNYGWLFDMGNFTCADTDALAAMPLARPYIFHVHAKDMIIKPTDGIRPAGMNSGTGIHYWRGTVLGHGQVPVVQTLRALHTQGYDGTVSLEFEGPEDCLSSIRFAHEYLRRIADSL